jgi:glycosyltransferase involved in cell wall biosynthesis
MGNLSISAIILTYNEEIHIRRCLENAFRVAKEVIVIDSFSTDRTVEIAKECGATVLQHKYVNQAQQFSRMWNLGLL